MEYKILEDNSTKALEIKINASIQEGWQLYGYLSITPGPWFVQAMTRETKAEEEFLNDVLGESLDELGRDYYDPKEITECPLCGCKVPETRYPQCWHCTECDFAACTHTKENVKLQIKIRAKKK